MTRKVILELLGVDLSTRKPNFSEQQLLDEESTHFKLIEDKKEKYKFVKFLEDDYLIFKCWSGRTSAIHCANLICSVMKYDMFFTEIKDDKSIYLLVRIQGV